jgi:hypothetical protein
MDSPSAIGTGEFHEIKEDKSDPGTEGRISR